MSIMGPRESKQQLVLTILSGFWAISVCSCSNQQEHIDAPHRVAPETILSGATNFILHEANADADIYMFEYSAASADPAAVISTIEMSLNTSWSRDQLTSTGLTVSKTETNKPFWDIQRQIEVFASPAGRVLVLAVGIDTPAEASYLESKTMKRYRSRVQQLTPGEK